MPTSNNFMENYKLCCSDSKTRVKVKSLSQDKCLQFNADRLDIEDWAPVTRAIRIDRSLHTLIIKSEYPGKKWRCSLVDNIKPSIHKPNVMQELMESIAICMKESNILSTIQLQSLSINRTHIEILSNGIKECVSLQHLAITRCKLNDNGVKLLCKTIRTHTGILTINFTNCNITREGARYIANLIRAQRLVRYSETWKQSLRYREPNPELLPGIRRITLNDNTEITDEGFSLIKHELMDDLWIRAIDMQNCGLTNISGDLSIELLNINTTICILDVRRNDMIVQGTIKTIKSILTNRNNIIEKHGGNEIEHNYNDIYGWLEGSAVSTNRSDICSSRKPNSEYSLKTTIKNNNIVNRLNLMKINSSVDELQQTKNFTNDMIVTSRNNLTDTKQKLELLKEHEKQKDQLAEKLVKEWNRRKLIEKERDKLKEELRNYITETYRDNKNNSNSVNNNNNNNYCIKISKSLNLKQMSNTTSKSLSTISNTSPTILKKSKKRNNKKLNKNKLQAKKSLQIYTRHENDHLKIINTTKNNSKMNNNNVISKSDSELKRMEEKYKTKRQNQNEIQNIKENLDKIIIKQFDDCKKIALKEEENQIRNINNNDKNKDGLENAMKKDFRDLSPTSRSQWILNELINGNKSRSNKTFKLNLNNNKYDEQIESGNKNIKIENLPKKEFGQVDYNQKWDLTVSF